MSEYEDMLKMQQDAVLRVREMQKRAKNSVFSVNSRNENNRDKPEDHEKKHMEENRDTQRKSKKEPEHQQSHQQDRKQDHHQENKPDPPPKKNGFDFLKMFNFKNLPFDSDTSLILLLIILLASEECDEIMLLALVYLIL